MIELDVAPAARNVYQSRGNVRGQPGLGGPESRGHRADSVAVERLHESVHVWRTVGRWRRLVDSGSRMPHQASNSGNGRRAGSRRERHDADVAPATASSNLQYSTGGGNTWTSVTGLFGNPAAVADKVAPNLFYTFTGSRFYSTGTSGGTAFSK